MMMEVEDVNTSSRWVKLLYYLWKIFTCLFLHILLITIVVSYCFFGMYMFKKLEEDYEKEMKKNITNIRKSISNDILKFTFEQKVLHKSNWTAGAYKHLQAFEEKLVWAMRKGGWNGNDNETALMWTNDGALFYSVIVITTIAVKCKVQLQEFFSMRRRFLGRDKWSSSPLYRSDSKTRKIMPSM